MITMIIFTLEMIIITIINKLKIMILIMILNTIMVVEVIGKVDLLAVWGIQEIYFIAKSKKKKKKLKFLLIHHIIAKIKKKI